MISTMVEMLNSKQELAHGATHSLYLLNLRVVVGTVQVNTLLSMVATVFLPLTFLCGIYGILLTGML